MEFCMNLGRGLQKIPHFQLLLFLGSQFFFDLRTQKFQEIPHQMAALLRLFSCSRNISDKKMKR